MVRTRKGIYIGNQEIQRRYIGNKLIFESSGNQATKYALRIDGVLKDFYGDNHYIRLPPLTMDSIEIDCLVDEDIPYLSSGTHNGFLVDARFGATTITGGLDASYISTGDGVGGGWKEMLINGSSVDKTFSSIPLGERLKLKLNAEQPFSSRVVVFSNWDNQWPGKGIVYNIKCFLNGELVREFDLSNLDLSQFDHISGDWELIQ